MIDGSIALIDTSGETPRLRYVFDVADTGTRDNSRAVRLWELQEKHESTIQDMLERSYGVSGENGLLTKIGDEAGLCEAMCYLADNETERKRFGENAKLTAELPALVRGI